MWVLLEGISCFLLVFVCFKSSFRLYGLYVFLELAFFCRLRKNLTTKQIWWTAWGTERRHQPAPGMGTSFFFFFFFFKGCFHGNGGHFENFEDR